MKKLGLFLIGLVSFIGISEVKADNIVELSSYSENYDDDVAFYLSHQNEINAVIEVWEENFSMQYPYYYIHYTNVNGFYNIVLMYSSTPDITYYGAEYPNGSSEYFLYNGYIGSDQQPVMQPQQFSIMYSRFGRDGQNPSICYGNKWSNVDDNCTSGPTGQLAYLFWGSSNNVGGIKSLPLINHGIKYSLNKTTNSLTPYDVLTFNGFTSSTYNQTIDTFNVEPGDILPDIVGLYNGTYTPEETDTYEEINLNDYPYVILSLESYTPIDTAYTTNIYTLGSLCLTPVYDYGMKEKKNYYSGYQVQGCSSYYTSYTPVSVSILPDDVKNHAVYYIKSDNTYVTNSIKVDTDIFNITYITSEDEENPSVSIGGRSYPTIPYNDLTDTAIISSENGYISGVSCPLGDTNCYTEQTGIDISDLFTHPLTLLQTLWSSIINIFTIIQVFIMLLPVQLQAFMFTAFMLSVILGIIKIIL